MRYAFRGEKKKKGVKELEFSRDAPTPTFRTSVYVGMQTSETQDTGCT